MPKEKRLYATLKLGFIGGGLNSAVGYAHWTASQLDNRWRVVSGCFSRDKKGNEDTASLWHIAPDKSYTDWREYIEQEQGQVDAVVVLTPTPFHDEIICALLLHGIPVICEKAMAATVAQSTTIQEALRASKGFLAVTFNYSGYPMLRELRRRILDGDLGRLLQLQVEMPADAFIQPPQKMNPQGWRLCDGEIPTILLDLAVHLHHLAYFLTGLKPLSVNADFHTFSSFEDIVDDAYLWVHYQEGMRASYWVSKTALGHRNGLKIRLFGEKSSAEWYQENPEHLHLYQKDSVRMTLDRGSARYQEEIVERFKPGHPAGFVEAFANLYLDIADALEEFKKSGSYESPYVYGWEHADEGLRLLAGAAQSHKTRSWISLEGGALR